MVRDFINIDCMDGMSKYPDNYFGLAIVDPPYGIDICSNNNGAGGGMLRRTKTATQNSQKKNETGRSQALWYKSGGVMYRAYTL